MVFNRRFLRCLVSVPAPTVALMQTTITMTTTIPATAPAFAAEVKAAFKSSFVFCLKMAICVFYAVVFPVPAFAAVYRIWGSSLSDGKMALLFVAATLWALKRLLCAFRVWQ